MDAAGLLANSLPTRLTQPHLRHTRARHRYLAELCAEPRVPPLPLHSLVPAQVPVQCLSLPQMFGGARMTLEQGSERGRGVRDGAWRSPRRVRA